MEQVLSHKHPGDYPQAARLLEGIKRRRIALSSRHRIIDTTGRVHHVVVVGDELRGEDGSVIGTHGFYIDANPAAREEQDRISAAVAEISENRAVIEQAKGMLMLLYGIDEVAAFELLRWRSQNANTKLRSLAVQLVSEFRAIGDEGLLSVRAVYDNALLTIHQRIGAE